MWGYHGETDWLPLQIGKHPLFINYIMRNIVTIEVYKKQKKKEIARVHSLTGNILSCWTVCIKSEGTLWVKNLVKFITGAGGKKGQTLIDAGVDTITDLK